MKSQLNPDKHKLQLNTIKNSNLSICALILCAGHGTRTGLIYNKMLHYIGKKTILEMTLDRFNQSLVTSIMLVIAPEDESAILKIINPNYNVSICYGGNTRTESVRNGLREISDCDFVVIHDGARPFVSPSCINRSIESAIEFGSGIVAVPTTDAIKEISDHEVVKSLSKKGLYNVQTPQTFFFERILNAYDTVEGDFSDDCEVYEKAGFTPRIVDGDYENIKITTSQDFLHPVTSHSKIGVGFDVHKLVADRKLILGGVIIPHDKGLLGHSDADVLTHAIMDAILSAADLPDIGVLFPDKDPKYKDANSTKLLAEVNTLIQRHKHVIGNISAVIMAQKPRLCEYISLMRGNLAKVLGLRKDQINISATTTEGLGIVGNEKGIASSATCLLFT